MTLPRLALLTAAVLVCAEQSSTAPQDSDNQRILPDAAAEAVEKTPCPEASGLSVEECLLWLTPDRPGSAVDAGRIARERGVASDGADVGAVITSRDGLRGRTKAPN